MTTPGLRLARTWGIGLAVAAPVLMAVNWPPSPTMVNQAISLGLWGVVAALVGLGAVDPRLRGHSTAVLEAAIVLTIVCVVASSAFGALPLGITITSAAVIAAAAVMVLLGALLAAHDAGAVVKAFLSGLLLAGLVSSAIALVQVFAPGWADGDLIARAALPGRAGANLRQPNHLSTLLLWSLIAWIGLCEWQRLGRAWLPAPLLLLCLALVLTGSRTGLLGVLALAVWGLVDRKLSRASRIALLALPLLYAAMWIGVSGWAHASGHGGGEGRMSLGGNGDISSSRFAIWANSLAMIANEPWLGVGFGEFNAAWTLTAFPHRPTAFFDHTHNLPLQLLAELGVPLGLLLIGALALALVQAARRAWAEGGDLSVGKRAAFMIVLMVGLHSMLEYPLWYAYFLLPAAFAWGFALAPAQTATAGDRSAGAPDQAPQPQRALVLAGLAMSIGASAAVLDYWRVVVIYNPPEQAAALEERIERGQRSPLFGQHADYAAATAYGEPKAPLSESQRLAFRRAPHQLLDVRLMIAWSQALAAQGEGDKARWLAARIREFHNPGADDFFAPCRQAEPPAAAFQCQPPTREVHWREFTQR